MKAIYCEYGKAPKIVDMVPKEDMFICGDDCEPGYYVPESADFVTVDDGEYFGFCLAMAMYEGAECCGSYPGYSWALVPESEDEAEHISKATRQHRYRHHWE